MSVETQSQAPGYVSNGMKPVYLTDRSNPSYRGSLEPWIKDEVEFFPHQVEGVKWLKTKKGALLADDMGLGKTLQMLAVFGMHLWRINKIDPERTSSLLVVVPVSLRDNWEEEVDKFTRVYAEKLEGSPAKRIEQLEAFKLVESNKILIVNYEQVIPHVKQLNEIGFSMIIADEAHQIKNPKAKRTKAFQELRAVRKFMLTGTPILKHVDDLWVLLDTISPGQWGTYYTFTHKYCVFGGFKNKAIVGLKNEQALIDKVNDVMLRRTKDKVLNLPDVQYIRRSVTLTPRQRSIYNFIVDTLSLDREDGSKPELIGNDAVKAIRLRQICATTATVIASGEDTSSKLDLAVEDATEITDNGNKLVVFTQFRPVVACYIRRFKEERPNVPVFEIHGDVKPGDRQAVVKKWAETKGPAVIVGIIKVMGTGLNMTAAKHAQFIDKEYSPALNRQAVDRLNRIGASTTQQIQVFEYFVKNSAESRVEKIIKDKNVTNDIIVNNKDVDFQNQVRAALEKRI